MKPFMIAAAAALLATGAAAAPPQEEWVRVGAHVDGGAVEIDRRSIAPWQGLWRAWWRITLATPRPDGTAVEERLDLVDCGQGLSSGLETVSLRADGSVAGRTREPESAALDRLGLPAPGTTGEMVAENICRLRPKPKPKRR